MPLVARTDEPFLVPCAWHLTSISCWFVARTSAACSGSRTAANTPPSTPCAAAEAFAAPPRRGVREREAGIVSRGARCVQVSSLLGLCDLRCRFGSKEVRREGWCQSVALQVANTTELAGVSRRNFRRPSAQKTVYESSKTGTIFEATRAKQGEKGKSTT